MTGTRQPATTTTTVEVGSVLSEGVVTSLLPAPDLPAEFPGDRVPLPRGAVVQRVTTGTDQGYLDYFLQLGLPGQTDAKAAADAYGGAMRPLGWTQVPLPSSVLVDTPSDVYVISFSNPRQELVTLFVDPSGSGLRGSLTYQRPS